MNVRERAAIAAARKEFCRDVIVNDIEDSLMESGLIDSNDKQRVHAERDTQRQSSTLVDILLQKNSSDTYGKLQRGLHKHYPHVEKRLRDLEEKPQLALRRPLADYEGVFIQGGIPIVPAGNVQLGHVDELKRCLVEVSRRPDGGWVLVHGAGGAGKSVMTAQAIRDADGDGNPIAAYFYNQVFWFTIGNLRSDEWESQLLSKMQNICSRLDPALRARPPTSLEEAKDLLRATLLEKYPCALVVLDNVWEPLVLKHFNVQARIAVTSRNADLLSRIQRGARERCKELEVKEGFTLDSSRELLAQMVSREFVDQNAAHIQQLQSKCKGNPFIVSLFGGLLADRPHMFEKLLQRFERNLLQHQSSAGDYEYSNIMDAIVVSIEDLSDENRHLYFHLSIFPEDSFLSPQFLSQYCWEDMDSDDAEEQMEYFVKRSIATKETGKKGLAVFSRHDLIVRVMNKRFSSEQSEYNDKFVRRVLACREGKGSWLLMDDDCDYLAYNFIYHLISARSLSPQEKRRILLDFDFITWLCCRIGSDNLAFVYHHTQKSLGLNELEDFEQFFRSPVFRIQSTSLSAAPSDSAVIQLALNLPEHNAVQQAARDAAERHKDFFCFHAWVNHEQAEEQIESAVKLMPGVVSFSLNPACTHAIVASECSVTVMHLATGRETYQISRETIENCASEEGAVIVTAQLSPACDAVLVLTETSVVRFALPADSLSPIFQESSSPVASAESTLHFPADRPRAAAGDRPTSAAPQEQPLYREDLDGAEFTTMRFENDSKLLLGCSDGRLHTLTVTDFMLNKTSEFALPTVAGDEGPLKHIAVSGERPLPRVAVCAGRRVHVYTSKYSVREYAGHRYEPVQAEFQPGPHPHFAASIANNELHLWSVEKLERLAEVSGSQQTTFTCLALGHGGRCLGVGASTRAQLCVYQRLDDNSVVQLEEFNGSGSYTKALAFAADDKRLYSVSELSGEAVLTRWRLPRDAELPRTPAVEALGDASLRLCASFDAADDGRGGFLVAGQSVSGQLLLLRPSGSRLQQEAAFDCSAGEAVAVAIAPDCCYSVFTFPRRVVVAELLDDSWQFVELAESATLADVVMLHDRRGFVGSDRRELLVVYSGRQRVRELQLSHTRLLPAPELRHSLAVLADRSWRLLRLSDPDLPLATAAGLGDSLEGSLLCLDACELDGRRFVAGGTDRGRLAVWHLADADDDAEAALLPVAEGQAPGACLRCLQFSRPIGAAFRLLAGVFDDHRLSIWSVSSDGPRVLRLTACQPAHIGAQLQPSCIGCVAWSAHAGRDGAAHHKLAVASDCVHVCCVTEADVGDGAAATISPGAVSLFTRQSVRKVVPLGASLLFVDNSHAVFWMRALHRDEAATSVTGLPEIPFEFSVEQA